MFERLLKRVFGMGEPDAALVAKGEEEVRRFGGVLDGWLAQRRYLCGESITLADFSVGAWLNYAAPAQFPLEPFRQIRRWHDELSGLPAWQASIVAPPF
jgi:glutathione S-transferase